MIKAYYRVSVRFTAVNTAERSDVQGIIGAVHSAVQELREESGDESFSAVGIQFLDGSKFIISCDTITEELAIELEEALVETISACGGIVE